jgi:hypothetical protein
MNPPTTIFDFH